MQTEKGNIFNETQMNELKVIRNMIATGKPIAEIAARWKSFLGDVRSNLAKTEIQGATKDAKVLVEKYIASLEIALDRDDAQLANVELQEVLQKTQSTYQILSNNLKLLHDTELSIIRKIGS